jgi:prepilin-type N-terminal cleavage/methylation domain-containing protein
MNPSTSLSRTIQPRPAHVVVHGQSGFTLIELMLGLTIGVAVLAAALKIFTVANAYANSQFTAIRQQQEVRLATPDSIQIADPDRILYHANLSALRTTTTGALLPGQAVIAVQDGSGWGAGKTIMICSSTQCESHRLARTGQRYQLTLVEPIESTFPAGTTVEVRNRVVYYAKHDETGTAQLMRMVDGGASVMIGHLRDIRLSYWNEMGKQADAISHVKRVVLEIHSDHSRARRLRDVSIQS